MTKEELEREINSNKFSEMKCFSDDTITLISLVKTIKSDS